MRASLNSKPARWTGSRSAQAGLLRAARAAATAASTSLRLAVGTVSMTCPLEGSTVSIAEVPEEPVHSPSMTSLLAIPVSSCAAVRSASAADRCAGEGAHSILEREPTVALARRDPHFADRSNVVVGKRVYERV